MFESVRVFFFGSSKSVRTDCTANVPLPLKIIWARKCPGHKSYSMAYSHRRNYRVASLFGLRGTVPHFSGRK